MFLIFSLANIIFSTHRSIEKELDKAIFGFVEKSKMTVSDMMTVRTCVNDMAHILTKNAELQCQCVKLEDEIKEIERKEADTKKDNNKIVENLKEKLYKCEKRRRYYREKRDSSKVTLKMLQKGIPQAVGKGCMYMFYNGKCEKYDKEIQKINDAKCKQMEQNQKETNLLKMQKCECIKVKNEILLKISCNNAKREDEINSLISMLVKYNGNEDDFGLMCRDKLISIQ